MNRRRLILPHAVETLAHQHVLLWDLLRRMLAAVVFASHGFGLDLERGRRRNYYRVLEGRKTQENEKQF